jgi:hypothetical protein
MTSNNFWWPKTIENMYFESFYLIFGNFHPTKFNRLFSVAIWSPPKINVTVFDSQAGQNYFGLFSTAQAIAT